MEGWIGLFARKEGEVKFLGELQAKGPLPVALVARAMADDSVRGR